MRVRIGGAVTRLLLVLAFVAGAVLSAFPLDGASPVGAPESGVARSRGEGKDQQNQGSPSARERAGKKNGQKKGEKSRKRGKQRHTGVPAALDAEQIAAANSAAVEALDCEGLQTIRVDGRTFCTHGNDPQMFGRAGTRASGARADGGSGAGPAQRPLCIDDGQSGPRVQLVYMYRNDRANRLPEFLSTFRRLASEMDAIVDQSARKTGGSLRIRFVTNAQCQVDILALAVHPNALETFGESIQELTDAGHNAANRKYLILADTSAYCGVGTFLAVGSDNSTKDRDKPDTTAHDLIGYARVDQPCWDAGTMIHELSHSLGAVQYSAPHTSRGAHCIDEWDVMCYSDAPFQPEMRMLCDDGAQDFRLDCNNDDYFAANPAPGSYLDKHWNIARSIYFTPGSGEVCPDAALEPDDAYWYAFWEVPMRAFTVGGTEARAFCDEPGDTDWILFPGQSGKAYEIETTNLGPDVDTQLVVYRDFEERGWEGMSTIAVNDNRAEDDPSSSIVFAAPRNGNYLVGISEAGSRAGHNATYSVSVRETEPERGEGITLSRRKARPKRSFTVTMENVTPTSEVTFWWRRGEKTIELGRATAGDDGIATYQARVPRTASPGQYEVGATSTDASAGTAPFQVKKKGGRDNKGGKDYKKHGKRHRDRGSG